MAKIRIRWRHIFRNIGKVIILVQTIMVCWEGAKNKLRSVMLNDPACEPLYYAIEELYETIVRRRK